MSITHIIDFAHPKPAEQSSQPVPEDLISGSPKPSFINHYTSACSRFNAGVWESNVGRWRVSFNEHEYCEILSGTCLIHDDNGNVKTVSSGDRFVIPAGFSGIWEVVEPCRKVYVCFE